MLKGCFSVKRCVLAICLAAFSVHAQPTITNVSVGTAFRYQGAIRGVFPNGVAQNGTLQFQFGLWDDPVNTDPVSQMASNIFTTLNVSNGFFSTMLDFGNVFNGRRAFLEVAVYAPSNTLPASSNWIVVSPRTEIGAVPYAMWALNGEKDIVRSEGGYKVNVSGTTDGFGSVAIPGGFGYVELPANGANTTTNISDFAILSVPKLVDEARILIGKKSWELDPPPCLTCYFTATLEVWEITNSVSSGFEYRQSLRSQFVRTLSGTNLLLGASPVGAWISLSLSNTVREVKAGEYLRLVTRASGGNHPENYAYMVLRSEVVVRNAP